MYIQIDYTYHINVFKLTYRTGSLLGLWWWYHMITKARCVCAINFERNKPETWKPQWLIMLTDRNLKPWIRLGSVWTSCFLIYPLKMVIFHSFLYVYQRVIELIYKNYPTYICIYFLTWYKPLYHGISWSLNHGIFDSATHSSSFATAICSARNQSRPWGWKNHRLACCWTPWSPTVKCQSAPPVMAMVGL